MPVSLVAEELTLEPNHIYVIAPGKELRCLGKTLEVAELHGRPCRPIDTFFSSLAANVGVPSIGIVLSGTGSDGSTGIEEIHESGGLQSVNEELHSVNAELQRKIEQFEETTGDLETFLNSSHIGTIFLDADQRIRKFTRATLRHFNLVNHDVGRPLSHFTNQLQIPSLSLLIGEVAATGNSHSSSRMDEYGEQVRLVIDPFRSGHDRSGTVLTILRESSDTDEQVNRLNSAQIGLWEWPDLTKDEMWWSPTCYKILGLDPKSPSLFSRWKQMIHTDDLQQLERIGTNHCKFIELGQLRFRMLNVNKEYQLLEFRNVSRHDKDQFVRSMVGTVIDTSGVNN